ncbi:MAG TPA: hypothetical protein VFW12_02265, partial [Candidatus Limnocylindria bacterium]|nr:hypothetical protein [Candidatus Limnocylindria bacterium]
MRAAQDFNYKVALASGLKSLQGGRLRQAEEQFRYLVSKFPGQDGGYRGLAKVLIELEDRPGAVAILREGASGLAKAGNRDAAIALLRDALALDPLDHGSHRRLSAALALAGDLDAAVSELHRYVDGQLVIGNVDHAKREIEYALERFGAHPRLVDLAERNGVTPSRASEAMTEDGSNGAALERPASFEDLRPVEPEPEPEPDEPQDPSTAEQRAARLIARRDPRAAAVALEAAEWHLLEGRTHAASDLLLQLISSEIAPHEAQLLLVDIVRDAGKPEVARAKCALLAQVLRLQGNE